jgi:hypothetical protein
MNERIKELANECWEQHKWGPAWFDNEKFAKLIISECSAVANHFSDGHIIDEFGRKMFHYRADIAQEINQYFGVEE